MSHDILGITLNEQGHPGLWVKDNGTIAVTGLVYLLNHNLKVAIRSQHGWAYSEPKQLILPMVFL